jgi:hypothetical protein
MGSDCKAECILNFGTRQARVIIFTCCLLLPRGKIPVRTRQKAGWATEPVWTLWLTEKSIPAGNMTPVVQPTALSLNPFSCLHWFYVTITFSFYGPYKWRRFHLTVTVTLAVEEMLTYSATACSLRIRLEQLSRGRTAEVSYRWVSWDWESCLSVDEVSSSEPHKKLRWNLVWGMNIKCC